MRCTLRVDVHAGYRISFREQQKYEGTALHSKHRKPRLIYKEGKPQESDRGISTILQVEYVQWCKSS